jgi:hypothetical protein
VQQHLVHIVNKRANRRSKKEWIQHLQAQGLRQWG